MKCLEVGVLAAAMLSLLIALLNSWMCLQSVVALKQSAFIFLEDVARRSIVVMPCACSIGVRKGNVLEDAGSCEYVRALCKTMSLRLWQELFCRALKLWTCRSNQAMYALVARRVELCCVVTR